MKLEIIWRLVAYFDTPSPSFHRIFTGVLYIGLTRGLNPQTTLIDQCTPLIDDIVHRLE